MAVAALDNPSVEACLTGYMTSYQHAPVAFTTGETAWRFSLSLLMADLRIRSSNSKLAQRGSYLIAQFSQKMLPGAYRG